MKKIVLFLALGAFVASCGGKKEEKKDGFEVSRTKTEEKKAQESQEVPVDLSNKGVGPIKNVEFADDIDQAKENLKQVKTKLSTIKKQITQCASKIGSSTT